MGTILPAAVRRPRHSVGHIFLYLKKDMEERQIKGAAAPLNPPGVNGDLRGDVLRSYEFAVMHFTRFRPVRGRAVGGFLFASRKKPVPPLRNAMRCTHCFPRTHAYCTHCGENVTFNE